MVHKVDRIYFNGAIFKKLILLISFSVILFNIKSILTPPDEKFFQPTQFIWTPSAACLKPKTGAISDAGNSKTLVIVINSARDNFHERQLIRETWGGIQRIQNWTVLATVFMLGEPSAEESAGISLDLESEHATFGDLVKGQFIDAYRNLTLKTIMAHHWLVQYCPDAHVVVKADDDIILNVFQLVEDLNKLPAHEIVNSATYYGRVYNKTGPVRDEGIKKWYISKEDFPGEEYPPYCRGTGMVMTMKVVKKVVEELEHYNGNYLWLEDVFMSGIIPAQINSNLKDQGKDLELIRHVDKTQDWYLCPLSPDGELELWVTRNGLIEDKIVNPEPFVFFPIAQSNNFTREFLNVWSIILTVHNPQ